MMRAENSSNSIEKYAEKLKEELSIIEEFYKNGKAYVELVRTPSEYLDRRYGILLSIQSSEDEIVGSVKLDYTDIAVNPTVPLSCMKLIDEEEYNKNKILLYIVYAIPRSYVLDQTIDKSKIKKYYSMTPVFPSDLFVVTNHEKGGYDNEMYALKYSEIYNKNMMDDTIIDFVSEIIRYNVWSKQIQYIDPVRNNTKNIDIK